MKNEINNNNSLDYSEMPPDDIFAYNELRSCADLFRLYIDDILEIKPDFQRNEIWSNAFESRFIDSLLKELPIPSMCFGYDKNKNKMKVIDGLQRMSSIINFLNTEKEWKMSQLKDIDLLISGKTNIEVKHKNPEIFKRIQNISLPITFLRVDYDNKKHNEYLFQIFYRLNTYGQKLNNQEIRNCIYNGVFNDFLKLCNTNAEWEKILNFTKDDRFAKVELLLRFFAFHDDYKKYDGILNKFLNDYMHKNRSINEEDKNKKYKLFTDTTSLVYEEILSKKPFKKASNALIDTLFVGIAKNLNYLKSKDKKDLKNYYSKLLKHKSLSDENIKEGVMKKAKVLERINASIEIFSGK